MCTDMHTKDALHAGESQQRLNLVAAWREAKFFTEAERAALEAPAVQLHQARLDHLQAVEEAQDLLVAARYRAGAMQAQALLAVPGPTPGIPWRR
jgi:alkylhydroperoxidase family enzyme